MSKRRYFRKLVGLFCCVIIGIAFFNTAVLRGDIVYELCDLGVSAEASATEHDAFLGKTLTWDEIIVKKTKNAPLSNEYKEGGWSVVIRKIKVEHRYSTNDVFQAKPEPTSNKPTTLSCNKIIVDKSIHLKQIKFTPEKAGYTRETYRVWIIVPKLLKSNGQQAKDAAGNELKWFSYKDITITYAVPEFQVVAVKFISDHGMLRPNVYADTDKPNCYKIDNAPTYKTMYPDGTLQWSFIRSDSGTLTLSNDLHIPITHTWKNADPTAKIKYTIRLKNFGATIKGNIYLGHPRPNNTNPTLTPPTEGNTSDYYFEDMNENDTVGYESFKVNLVFRYETNDMVIALGTLKQNVYWTFGTPQININEARMNIAVGYVFNGQTKTDTKQILQDMLNKDGMVNFNVTKCISDGVTNSSEYRNWNRLAEDGVDGISHSEFFQKVIKASGLPVSAGVQTYIATYALSAEPKRPETPIEGSFGWARDLYSTDPLSLKNDPLFPPGGARQASNAAVFPALQNKLDQLGQNSNASLIFYRGTSSENFEVIIILRDTKTDAILYNPGGTVRIHEENERNKVITNMMNTLEWQFWKTVEKIDTHTNDIYTEIYWLHDRIMDYRYIPIP
ncbi:MAG: hypothetical protein LBC74_05990 [Planctomycetaceae bacterium]|nr:hypothetical protein [Planctomycetaceae bacterium]